jgi:riboflavin kinase/FMN adenylyltransferase
VAGVANVGTRPTVDATGTRTLLEVHLFDFAADIYGRYVQVNFLHRIREERRFDSFEALKAQIHNDAEAARVYFTAKAQRAQS